LFLSAKVTSKKQIRIQITGRKAGLIQKRLCPSVPYRKPSDSYEPTNHWGYEQVQWHPQYCLCLPILAGNQAITNIPIIAYSSQGPVDDCVTLGDVHQEYLSEKCHSPYHLALVISTILCVTSKK